MFQRTKICSGLLLAFGSGLLSVAPGAFAQDSNVQRVEITGSAIRRVDAETSVPVTVLKADDLKAQGVTSVEDIMQKITASQVTQTTAQVVGNNTGGASYADIHGLGSNKTLVLLNGHRLANNAFTGGEVDLNMIPFAAIDRVEVLRDGASSLYGTDAIAGVINFITKRDYNGGNIGISIDRPQHPGGLQRDANIGFGFGDLDKNGLNVFGFVDFSNQQRITGTQRPFNVRQPGGLSPSTFPANYFQGGDAGNPAAPDCNANANLTTAKAATACQEATASFVDYTAASERVSAYGKATAKVGSGDSLFSLEGFASHDKVQSQIAPVPFGGLAMNPFLPDGVTPNPYYPGNAQGPTPNIALDPTYTGGLSPSDMAAAGLQPGYINVKWRDLSHGPRTDTPENDEFRILGKLEGSLGDWDYETNLAYSTNTVKDFVSGYSNGDLMTAGVLNGVINPFSATQSAAGQALINSAAAGGLLQSAHGELWDFDGHVGHELGDWFHTGKPSQISVGVEARSEKFHDSANPPVASILVASTGISPDLSQGGSRHIYAGFFELAVPVFKSLDVTLATRYDHYSDFGGTTNPKVSFRFEPTNTFLLRGSYSTGFRAPTLYDLYQAQSFGTPGEVDDPLYCPNGTVNDAGKSKPVTSICSTQPEVLNGGNLNLAPEKSKNATLGMVLTPVKNLDIETDYYRVTYTNQITSLAISTLADPANYALFSQYYHRNSQNLLSNDGSQCPGVNCGYIDTRTQNLGGVITDGIDYSVAYKLGLGSAGRLALDWNGTWVHKFGIQNFKGDAYHNNVGVYFDGSPVFRWKQRAQAAWTLQDWTLGVAGDFKSGYLDEDPSNKVKDYRTMDAWVTWAQKGAKAFSATLGVRNLFDRDPPYSNQVDVFQANYDPRFYDPTGRTFYFRGNYSF